MSQTHPAVAAARSFVAEAGERAAEFESARRISDDLARRMAQAGLFRMLVPSVYGGGQVHPDVFFDVLETVARADGAAGWCVMIGATTGLTSATMAEPWARRIFADHPDVVTCGVTAPLGRAVRVNGGIRVTGQWPFGSASQVADWICGGCFVFDDEADEQPVAGRHGPQTLLAFFPASEVTIHDTWHTSGLCGTGSHHIEVTNAFVPEERWAMLGGRPHVTDALYTFPTLGLLALGVSAVSLGIALHAIDAFVDLAGGKVPTGSARTLAARAGVQRDVALAVAAVRSARAYTRDVVADAWAEAEQNGRMTLETKASLRLAATNNAWSAVDAVTRLYHAAGGSSVYLSSDLQRCFRDVHVPTQHIMVAQPTYEVVGKVQLGIDPKTLL